MSCLVAQVTRVVFRSSLTLVTRVRDDPFDYEFFQFVGRIKEKERDII